MPAIEVQNLTRVFKTVQKREGLSGAVRDLFSRQHSQLVAVNNISFALEPGEMIGFIGPNGAGKSTTIKMLAGILKPSSGHIQAIGFSPFHDRRQYTLRIGAVFGQRTQLWWDIAVIESLRLLGSIYRVSEADFERKLDELTQILDLGDLLHTPVRKLSLGQRIRSDLAASLIHSPEILFLDEPTIGLDAVVKVKVRKFLREIKKLFNTTVILTTHDLYEIEELCERVIIIDKGSIIYDGLLDTIRSLPGLKRRISVDFHETPSQPDIHRMLGSEVLIENPHERRFEIEYDPAQRPTVEILRSLVEHFNVADVAVNEPGIESVIMKIYQDGSVS